MILFETYRRSKQETSKREDVAEQIEKLENQVTIFRKAFVELEKETLRINGKGPSGTRRILPKEVYELEEEDERESGPKGWRSWFQAIYRQNDPKDQLESTATISTPPIELPEKDPRSKSPEQNATAKNESNSTSILSKIVATTHKNESTSHTQQAAEPLNRTSTGINSLPKQSGSKT